MDPRELNSNHADLKEEVFDWLVNMKTNHKIENLMRTLTRDRDIRCKRLMSNADGLDWSKCFRIEHLGVGVVAEFQYLSRAIRQFQTPADDDAESRAWLRLYSESIGNRRVVMTQGYKLGLAPAATEEQDAVCIMDGLDVPLVLRKVDSRTSYVWLEESYIHGAMDVDMKAEAEMIDLK